MPADSDVELDGTIIDVLPAGTFSVKPDHSDDVVYAHLSGKMRMHAIRIVLGDRVSMVVSAYDLTRGRITKRI